MTTELIVTTLTPSIQQFLDVPAPGGEEWPATKETLPYPSTGSTRAAALLNWERTMDPIAVSRAPLFARGAPFFRGVVTACALAIASFSAVAQPTANGPYYANPAWDQILPATTRFIVLSNFNSEAVLDRESGLVWEKSPATTTNSWYNSLDACAMRAIGGRKGWRLPSVHELASLVDPAATNPALPSGHPFLNVQSAVYWSAAIRVNSAPWIVNFSSGAVSFESGTDGPHYAWCVRGGQNHARDY